MTPWIAKKSLVANRLLKFIPRRRRYIYKILSNRFFPLSFWIRNRVRLTQLNTLIKGKSPSWRNRYFLMNLVVRIKLFRSITGWLKNNNLYPSISCNNIEPADYCKRCGFCCEIASGRGIFPEEWPFPEKWKDLFSNGCGNGQLFCAFLLEDRRCGTAVCAIYPYRPFVCRLFGKEECSFLQNQYLDAYFLRRFL